MRLSDPVLVYGDPTSSTHILVQKKDTEKHPLYYSLREVNGKIACYTRFPENAKYFGIRSFTEEDFHEIIKNVHPSELVNIVFCDFGDKNPNEISRNDIYNYISYEHQNFFGYFSTFLTELKDSFISQREVIDSILVKPKEKDKYVEKQEEPKELEIIYKYDNTRTIRSIRKKIDGDKMIITRGVLEKYELYPIHKYSDQLKPGERKTTKGDAGFEYTEKFEHPYGTGIAKEAIAPIIEMSIYEHPYTSNYDDAVIKENNFLTNFDLSKNKNSLYKAINDLPDDYIIGGSSINYKVPSESIIHFDHKKKTIRIKSDPEILKTYPNAQLGSIVYKQKPSIGIIPTNEIIEKIEEISIVKDMDFNLLPTSKTFISVHDLLTYYLHSKLYNIPIKQIRYKAKWKSGHITELDKEEIKERSTHNKYQTPFDQVYGSYENKIDNIYGISIDVSNVAKRSDLVDLLRNLLIEYATKTVWNTTTISVEFGERIIVKIEPFYKEIKNKENTLYIHAHPEFEANIHNFTKQKWNQLYSKWANEHKDLIKSNELDQKLGIDKFWSIHKNKVQTDQRIEPPKDDVMICYINYHPLSKDLKIGRSKSWESRYSLYTRAKPPVDKIDPDCILRYYLKCPIHQDSVITDYLYVCMEDFFKQFSDKQEYLKRHKSPSGKTTEYYSLKTKKDINDQLNEYVADITDAFLNLTLKGLADVRKPSIKGDGIHGGKRQEFFNKVNQYTKEKMYDVENALQIIANLDDTKKLRDYEDFEKRFLPKFK